MKKDFTAAAADVFVKKMATPGSQTEQQPQDEQKEPKRRKRATIRTDSKHNTAGEERVTLFVDVVALEKLRTIAWTNKRKFKDVIADAMHAYLVQYEKEHGEVATR